MTAGKIEKYIFYILIFSIPLQTRKFLYSVDVAEGFNEWHSVFIYGTDILLLGLLFLWAINIFLDSKNPNHKAQIANFKSNKLLITYCLLLTTLLFSAISIFIAPFLLIAGYRFIKLLLFIGLFWYVVTQKFKFRDFALPFSAGAVLQALIAIGQFLKQSSLGLTLLGESHLAAGREDVAEMVAFGARFMRAYGTFSSPNVLAAFLALAIFILVTWFLTDKRLQSRKNFILTFTGLVLIGLGLLFTFSRSVLVIFVPLIVLYFAAIFVFKSLRALRQPAKKLAMPAGAAAFVFGLIYFPEIYERFITNVFQMRDLAIVERRFLFYTALEFIRSNPMGVGLGNFTLHFREVFWGLRESLYQPAHNIYLLAAAEIGVLGGLAFVGFVLSILWQSIIHFFAKQKNILAFFSTFTVLFIILTGLFDHYYWTLQQGALVFWAIAGLAVKICVKNRFA